MGKSGCSMPGIISLLLAIFCWSVACARGLRLHDEERLYRQILADYVSTVRPVVNGSGPLEVLFSLRLNQIVQLDERQQVLTTNVFIDQTWTDPALSWDPEDFKDVRSLTIPEEKVWKPDTFLYNNADNGSTGFVSGTYIQIRHTGAVTWPASVRLQSSCVVKITYFPFDYQFCMLRFGSWIYSQRLVDFAVQPDMISVDTSSYINNSQWELLHMKMDKSLTNRSHASTAHPHLTVVIYLKRNTFYYLFNIIVPCVMLSVLTLMTFWLPPTSGEKVTLGLSVFLAFSMFMLLIAEEVPASSDAVPLIGIYLCVVMTMTSLSVIFAVAVTNLHHRGSKLRPAPRWLSTACVRHLAHFLRVSQDVQLLASTICLSDTCKYFILHDHGLHPYQTGEASGRNGDKNRTPHCAGKNGLSTSQNDFQSVDARGSEWDNPDVLHCHHGNKTDNCHSSNSQSTRTPEIQVTQHSEEISSLESPQHTLSWRRTNCPNKRTSEPFCPNKRTSEPFPASDGAGCHQEQGHPNQCRSFSGTGSSMHTTAGPDNCEARCETVASSPADTGGRDFVFHHASARTKDPRMTDPLADAPSSPPALSAAHWESGSEPSPAEGSRQSSPRRVDPSLVLDLQERCSVSAGTCADQAGKHVCDCCNDEQVWVLREDLAVSNEGRACSPDTSGRPHPSDADSRASCEQDDDRRRWRKVNGRSLTPFRSGRIRSSGRVRRLSGQSEYERVQVEMRSEEVVLTTKYMIAEWCTIAQVIDRLLFLLSLLLTVFAYVFILVVLPSEHDPGAENSAFTHSLHAAHYMRSS
ncbi:neuronal acetylcholine receptor subunit alpha-9-I [Aplysia californica]|uniref:Neuronal acetylcholine receptor subunit alpha-9-I n=1 Tax=Aplysia californica TaxID=6500 RepID=A0ABM1VZ43_APLCA|nr:neuronal acetylcholine receptor subunit alpha-9-I [Aplysia californica]